MSGPTESVRALIVLNIICSVCIVTVRRDGVCLNASEAVVCARYPPRYGPLFASTRAACVQVNKLLVEYFRFKFVLLLTSLHFFTGYLFLRFASAEGGCKLFTRAVAPWKPILQLSIAGAGSIALLNYSLRFNSVSTYQIMKVAILPVTMSLSFFQNIAKPTSEEVGAAAIVIFGTLVCTVSDVSASIFGLALGVAGVVSTAQYQIWQGSIQKEHGLTSTQALYLMSPPQAAFALMASLLLETNWGKAYGYAASALGMGVGASLEFGATLEGGEGGVVSLLGSTEDDIWHHPYRLTELGALLATCVFAVGLNYSTIAVIGKTSAVTMQVRESCGVAVVYLLPPPLPLLPFSCSFWHPRLPYASPQFVNQLKTALTIGMGLLLFPKEMSTSSWVLLGMGLTCVFSGVAWYTSIKVNAVSAAARPATVLPGGK